MKLSENFNLDELLYSSTGIRKGIDNTPGPEELANLRRLVMEALQPLRDELGPIRINSGYRCPKLNKAVGGAPTSQHMLGLAADFVPQELDLKAVFNWIRNSGIPFDQLILEFGTWIHISVAPDGQRPRRQVLEAKKVNGRTTYVKVG